MMELAKEADMERILEIYAIAKRYMHENGNPNQWNGAYPDRETLENDIRKQRLYVYRREGVIRGVFVLLTEAEPTYDYIEGGNWLNDEPYGTIHRIASDGTFKGFFGMCARFALKQFDNIRVDTHRDNHKMQAAVLKFGFVRCGTIYLKSGDSRIAYQYSLAEKT